jgi:hypothetical protein
MSMIANPEKLIDLNAESNIFGLGTRAIIRAIAFSGRNRRPDVRQSGAAFGDCIITCTTHFGG